MFEFLKYFINTNTNKNSNDKDLSVFLSVYLALLKM